MRVSGESERQLRRTEAREQIQAIAAEQHAKLPRNKAKEIGAIYVRYSTLHQDSVADQVRTLYEAAVAEKIFVPVEHVFFDLAVRGCKSQRTGLDELRELLARKGIETLLVFATNRLFRKTYKALQFIEEEVVERGIRCVFVKSGVDTADTKQWRNLLHLHAIIDETGAGMYAENIRAAQEGLFNQGCVFGTVSFGYQGVAIPGETTRRGKPKRKLKIDPGQAEWVKKIYRLYTEEGMSIGDIIRRLNSTPNVPLPPKSAGRGWTRLGVKRLLTNPRYRGCWAYGTTQSTWISSKDYTRQIDRDEPLRSAQMEELRIVSDDTWHAAQKRLAQWKPHNSGRKPKNPAQSRPRVVNGLFWCPTHDRALHLGGVEGRYLVCPDCRNLPPAQRTLFSQLNLDLAIKLTCEAVAEVTQQDEETITRAIQFCREEAERLQRPDPQQMERLQRRSENLTQQIQFLLRNQGATDTDQQEARSILDEHRRERTICQADLATMQALSNRKIEIPSESEIRQQCSRIGEILLHASTGDNPEQAGKVREILWTLTGGKIVLSQCGERKAQRGWLQGRFSLQLVPTLLAHPVCESNNESQQSDRTITIDYREASELDRESEKAGELYIQGRLRVQIAAELGCSLSYVTKLLRHWHAVRGLSMPDGRSRRTSLPQKQRSAPVYQSLSDQAYTLWEQGSAISQIAATLGCSEPTVRQALEYWYRSREFPIPDSASRRETLLNRMEELYRKGLLFRDIAKELGLSSQTVSQQLRARFESRGEQMPDGRTRRHNLENDSGEK